MSVTEGLVRNVRVGRQGIYDADRSLLAYELSFRSSDGEPGAGEPGTSQVIATTFGTFGLDNIAAGRPVFINFTRPFLIGSIPIPVDPAGVVIEVMESRVDAELLAGLALLRSEGYRLAAADYRGEAEQAPLLDLVAYVRVDVGLNPPEVVARIAGEAHSYEAALIAAGVRDEQTLTECIRLGFELFQGPVLQRPTVLERRTLSPSQLICARLLGDLSDPDVELARIEQMVGSDPGLTMRLLRTANSAATSTLSDVTSLRQALVLIGARRLRSWVVLTLLEGGSTATPTDGLWNTLARAIACQRLGADAAELAFTIGLLSGAAELLGVEPEVIAEEAGISSEARDALLTGEGAAGRALMAVLAHERDDEEGVASTGLRLFDVSRTYLEALSEALKLVTEINR
jgi:c-di-GMP phosphodiesterase